MIPSASASARWARRHHALHRRRTGDDGAVLRHGRRRAVERLPRSSWAAGGGPHRAQTTKPHRRATSMPTSISVITDVAGAVVERLARCLSRGYSTTSRHGGRPCWVFAFCWQMRRAAALSWPRPSPSTRPNVPRARAPPARVSAHAGDGLSRGLRRRARPRTNGAHATTPDSCVDGASDARCLRYETSGRCSHVFDLWSHRR